LKPLPTFFVISSLLLLTSMACKKDAPIPKNYKAKKVVVIIIDGPRYSETFGDTSHQYIPELYQLSKQGVLFTNMYNIGITNTLNGLAAITTGNYGALPNNGTASPIPPTTKPSMDD
jgi:predicted AlkP superfamily pyrophosphatase or phosphodiesterase